MTRLGETSKNRETFLCLEEQWNVGLIHDFVVELLELVDCLSDNSLEPWEAGGKEMGRKDHGLGSFSRCTGDEEVWRNWGLKKSLFLIIGASYWAQAQNFHGKTWSVVPLSDLMSLMHTALLVWSPSTKNNAFKAVNELLQIIMQTHVFLI